MPAKLRRLTLDEVSMVDRGANPHAHIKLFKRDRVEGREYSSDQRQQGTKEGWAMSDGSYPIKDKEDLGNAIKAYGRAKNKSKVKSWIMRRAKALDALDMIPDEWKNKRAVLDEAILATVDKAYGEAGAKTFQELIDEAEERRRQYEVSDFLWPLFCALQESIQSIIADSDLSSTDRLSMIKESVQGFYTKVENEVPDVEAEIEKLLRCFTASAEILDAGIAGGTKETEDMDLQKQIDELKTTVAKLTADVTALTTENASLKTENGDLKKRATALETDEVIKVGSVEIKKSVVGEATFTAMKAQQEQITKQADDLALVDFTKKATAEVGNLPGTDEEKGKVYKAISGIADEAVRKSVTEMLKAGSAAIAEVTKSKGKSGGDPANDTDDPDEKLEALAKKYASENKVSFAKAYEAVLESDEGRRIYAEKKTPKGSAE